LTSATDSRLAIAYLEPHDDDGNDYFGNLFAAAPEILAERDKLKNQNAELLKHLKLTASE
jgi:hypothetical protein